LTKHTVLVCRNFYDIIMGSYLHSLGLHIDASAASENTWWYCDEQRAFFATFRIDTTPFWLKRQNDRIRFRLCAMMYHAKRGECSFCQQPAAGAPVSSAEETAMSDEERPGSVDADDFIIARLNPLDASSTINVCPYCLHSAGRIVSHSEAHRLLLDEQGGGLLWHRAAWLMQHELQPIHVDSIGQGYLRLQVDELINLNRKKIDRMSQF
jgi:hypothetical protein